MSYITPTSLPLDEGQYEIAFPANTVLNSKSYQFSSWEDGSTDPVRMLVLNQDKMINANYVEVITIANVTMSGTVSAQMALGETVTITITKPDATVETVTALTDASRNYTATKQYAVSGTYSAKAAIAADAGYAGATSPTVQFTISPATRTITITAVVA